MLFISFVVAVPLSQLRASPRKGSKLLLWQMCVCGWLDLQILWLFHQNCICPECLKVPHEVLIVARLGLMVADPEIKVVVVSYQVVY